MNIFTLFPGIFMSIFLMIRMVGKEFKIFNSIISSISIYMMDSFRWFKFSSEMLFHYMSMLKNALSIYIDSYITKFSKAWLTFFKDRPIRRNIIISMTSKSISTNITPSAIRFTRGFITPFRNAYSWFHKLYYIDMVKECQIKS